RHQGVQERRLRIGSEEETRCRHLARSPAERPHAARGYFTNATRAPHGIPPPVRRRGSVSAQEDRRDGKAGRRGVRRLAKGQTCGSPPTLTFSSRQFLVMRPFEPSTKVASNR